VHPTFLRQVLQNTAWQLVFRQGTLDSAVASRMLGAHADTEQSWRSDGHTTTRDVAAIAQAAAATGERVNVSPSLLEALPVGDAWLRVAPVGRPDVRIERELAG
jgi:hypothetical protein